MAVTWLWPKLLIEKLLLNVYMEESIDGHDEFALDYHLVTLEVRKVPVCPSGPCSLASFVEATLMVDFPTSGGDDESRRKPSHQSREEYG